MICVVLGMHKSGTTLIARALHEAGISMIPGPPKGAYPREKYEWGAFKSINHALLGSQPDDSLGVVLGRPLDSGAVVEQAADRCIEQAGEFGDWGFKDPRTTLTYPFWRERLPPHKVVAIRRDPNEVMTHYARQGDDPYEALRHWKYYNNRLIEDLQCAADAACFDFNQLLDHDSASGRLADFIGRDLPDVRDPALCRCRS